MADLLEGQVAVVVGGGRGIGRGIVLAFAKEGATVVVADLDGVNADLVAKQARAYGAEAIGVPVDVRRRGEVDSCVDSALREFKRIDALVNTAISGSPVVAFMDTTDEMMQTLWESGTRGSFYFMQACYPHLKRRGGTVINFGSGSGVDGVAGYTAYGQAKEGIRVISKVAAREWGPDGIRVNVICPYADSPLHQAWAIENPDRAAANAARVPLGRVGDCETDIGSAAVFLASDLSRYVTGQTIMVDGGMRPT